MQTKTINGILCRRVMPGEIVKQGDMWEDGVSVVKLVGDKVSPFWSRELFRPMKQETTGTEAKVCADIAARQAKGIAKYGTTVADNPPPRRQWLQHAYEDALDLAVDLRRLIDEDSA